MRELFLAKIIIFFIVVTTGYAQQQVPSGLDPGQLMQQQKQFVPTLQQPSDIPDIKKDEIPKVKSDTSVLRVKVKEFKLTGKITRFSTEELQSLIKDLVGRDLTLQEIQQAAERITAYYRAHGYFIAQAILLKQDVTDGIVSILILEGALDDNQSDRGIKIEGKNLRLKEEHIRGIILEAVPLGKGIRHDELEKGILLLNDLPGISSSANLEAGTSLGSTRVVIDVNEGPILNPYIMFDNYGSRFTGAYRTTVSLNLNDITGRGDQLTLTANKNFDGQYNYGSIGYSRPIGYSGLSFGVTYSQLSYKLGKELKTLDMKGEGQNLTLTAKYPLIKTRLNSTFLNFIYDYKRTKTSSFADKLTDKTVNVYTVGLFMYGIDEIMGGGFSQMAINLHIGDLELGRVPASLTTDTATVKSNGGFGKVSFSALRIQRLIDKVNLNITVNGQIAGKNLDSSEKMSLGGPTGVRAYPGSEATGDNAVKVSIELRYNAFHLGALGDLQLMGFYDIGQVMQYKKLWPNAGLNTPNSYKLQTAGIGLQLAKQGRYDAKLQYAWKVGDNHGANTQGNDSDGKSPSGRLWFSMNAMF